MAYRRSRGKSGGVRSGKRSAKAGYSSRPKRATRSASSYRPRSTGRSGAGRQSSGNVLRIELAPGLSAGGAVPFGMKPASPLPPRGRTF